MVKSEKYNNTILAVAEDDSVDEVECMMRNKSVQIVGGAGFDRNYICWFRLPKYTG